MAEDRHVERGAGRQEACTPADGVKESGENQVGASVRAGARVSGQGTVHMAGAILSPEDLLWPAGAILRNFVLRGGPEDIGLRGEAAAGKVGGRDMEHGRYDGGSGGPGDATEIIPMGGPAVGQLPLPW
ncbi:unnamed protein product [Lampetra fluviatilis]